MVRKGWKHVVQSMEAQPHWAHEFDQKSPSGMIYRIAHLVLNCQRPSSVPEPVGEHCPNCIEETDGRGHRQES